MTYACTLFVKLADWSQTRFGVGWLWARPAMYLSCFRSVCILCVMQFGADEHAHLNHTPSATFVFVRTCTWETQEASKYVWQ